jgi:hypothetical protein
VIFSTPVPNLENNEPKTRLKIAVTDSFGAVRIFTFIQEDDEEDPLRVATPIKTLIEIGQEITNRVGDFVDSLLAPTNHLLPETAMRMFLNFLGHVQKEVCYRKGYGVSSFVDKCCENPSSCPEEYVNFDQIKEVLQSTLNLQENNGDPGNEHLSVVMSNTLPSVSTLQLLLDQNLPRMVGFVAQDNEYFWGIVCGYQITSSTFDLQLQIALPARSSNGGFQDSIGIPISRIPRRNILWISYN